MGWTVPPKWYIQVLTLVHVNVILLRNRVFEDLIEQRWGHIRLEWDLNPMTGVLLRRGEDTQRNTHVREKAVWAGERSQAASRHRVQGCPQPPGAGRGKEWFFSRACRGSNPADTLISDSGSQNSARMFLLLLATQFVALCYSSLRNKYTSIQLYATRSISRARENQQWTQINKWYSYYNYHNNWKICSRK